MLFSDISIPTAPAIDTRLVGVDFCRPEVSGEELLEDVVRKNVIQLPGLSDFESETESIAESSFSISLDAGCIGSLVENPVSSEEEDLVFNERTRTFNTKPSILCLFACPSGFPSRLDYVA
jgi:hypothetical protein